MIGDDLTSISTQGWFSEVQVKERILPVLSFGWAYDEDNIISGRIKVYNLGLIVQTYIRRELER